MIKRVYNLILLIWYYLVDLVRSNIQVTMDIITPGEKGHPSVVKLETICNKDIQVFALACFIAMTPGSLCIKVSNSRRFIWVHHLYPQNIEGLLRTIRSYEKRIVEIF